MDPFLKRSSDSKPSNKHLASKGRFREDSEQEFIPKTFVSSRANKNAPKLDLVNKDRTEARGKPDEGKERVRFIRKNDDGREYGPTMPPESLCEKEEVKELDAGMNGFDDKRLIGEWKDEAGDELVSNSGNGDGKSDLSKIVDNQYEEEKVNLNTHQVKLQLSSLRFAQKKNEKTGLEPQPLFSNILSAQDMERIKKVKEFVKSKDNPKQKLITLEMMPFKDDPIKNKRCYNFFCEMEGLEIGGFSAARLMTASEIRREREEFTEFYQNWKNSFKSSSSQSNSSEIQGKSIQAAPNDPSPPLKRQNFQSEQITTKKFPRYT